MAFLERFSVQSRLIFVVVMFTILLAIGGGVGWRIMVEGSQQSDMLMDEHVRPSSLLNQIRTLQADNRTQLLLALQHDENSPFVKMHDHPLGFHLSIIDTNAAKVSELVKQYRARKFEEPEEDRLFLRFESTRDAYVKDGILPTIEMLKSGDFLRANEIILKKVNPLFKTTSEAGGELSDYILKAAELEVKAFDRRQRTLMFGFGGIVSLGVLLAVAITWATLVSIVKPLREIVRQFNEIAQGNLQQEIRIHGDNELTTAQVALSRVQNEMRGMIGQVVEAAQSITGDGHALATEVGVVVHNSQSQSDGVMHVSAAMEEVTVSVGEVAQHAEQAAGAAREATKVVEQGALAVEHEIRNTQLVVDAVETSTQRMTQLQGGIDRIGDVTKVIRDVADQTNLLALNAAIEAARAGEQGRGFAVVADEVRKLAERTSASTADISRLISEIQNSAAQAVQAMEDARGKVEVAQNSARDSGESLTRMRGATEQVSQVTQQISLATNEQSTAAMSVTQSMERISSLISDTHARVEHVESVSRRLGATAERLTAAVRVFRI